MTVRAIKIKGEQISFLAHDDSAEQLITGTATGSTPTGWNLKVKGTAIYWVDNDGAERSKVGTLTGGSRAAGSITVHGEQLYYGDKDGDERLLSAITIVTVYPDLDGSVGHQETLSWADIVIAAGNQHNDTGALFIYLLEIYSATGSSWYRLGRSILVFDVSALVGETITGATLTVYANIKTDGLGISPDINLYSSDPASNTELANGDFDSFGTDPYCDTPIAYADWGTLGVPRNFILNTAGLAALQAAIDGDGFFKVGFRNANYDVAEELDPNNHAPAWSGDYKYSRLGCIPSEYGTSKPQLAISYS